MAQNRFVSASGLKVCGLLATAVLTLSGVALLALGETSRVIAHSWASQAGDIDTWHIANRGRQDVSGAAAHQDDSVSTVRHAGQEDASTGLLVQHASDEVGEVIAVRLDDGRVFLVRVLGEADAIGPDCGGADRPQSEQDLLDCPGSDALPTREATILPTPSRQPAGPDVLGEL